MNGPHTDPYRWLMTGLAITLASAAAAGFATLLQRATDVTTDPMSVFFGGVIGGWMAVMSDVLWRMRPRKKEEKDDGKGIGHTGAIHPGDSVPQQGRPDGAEHPPTVVQ